MKAKLFHIVLLYAALTPVLLCAQDQKFRGWPGHDDISDLKEAFLNPPRGYGNVPFYWWSGDSLDVRRLAEQLEILSEAPVDGLCVSYHHTHDKVDVEINAEGHGPSGRVCGGNPRVMSEQWWKIWNEYSSLCAGKGIGLGMDDYVIAWPHNGEFIDSILAKPSVRDYQGQLLLVTKGRREPRPSNALTTASCTRDSIVYVCTAASPWLYPELGAEIVREYFQQFPDHMDADARKGMNYFFQDELCYGLTLTSWSGDMREQFRKRKGYDILPHLADLFIDSPEDIGPREARVRLDYAEVLTQLAEERYFKPLFDWNADKGLIYGCDQFGRGLRPTQYLDYFRATSWFTAPGNDAPARGSSFLQTKVSSSIAHMYGRPRTWLEAFHSMGWDANGTVLRHQLDHHVIAGGNLLCMHGLYYSTHGGWWEWAPPCFHFRMPYWPHMKLWLKYAERLCFLLSQGSHVCDIAILYPTETLQAIPGSEPKRCFSVSDDLSIHGMDYDFIDYGSLQKAVVTDAALNVAGEKYKVLVLVDADAMHRETLSKIREFIRKGGKVVAIGNVLPEIRRAGALVLQAPSSVVPLVDSLIVPDFSTSRKTGRVLHRRIGERDVYMVMDVEKGDTMRFRASGRVERWNAMDGSVTPLPVVGYDGNVTEVLCDVPPESSSLIVFSPGEPLISLEVDDSLSVSSAHIDGDWDITIIPTLDNRWGDFRLPAFDGKIGVEARVMEYADENGRMSGKDCYGYGPYMEFCDIADGVNIDSLLIRDMPDWKPYVWSWQYGVPDSPGSQGWHGLKSRIDPRFLILDGGGTRLFRTNVIVPEDGTYRMLVEGVAPSGIFLDGRAVSPGPVELTSGRHALMLSYSGTRKTEYSLRGMRGGGCDTRDRSMVVFYPSCSAGPREYGIYDKIVASKWFDSGALEYDVSDSAMRWIYNFDTAPGTASMSLDFNGEVEGVEVDGNPLPLDPCLAASGHMDIAIPNPSTGVSKVRVRGLPASGCPGPAFFREPVRLTCIGGRMPEGDWSSVGALAFYSGAIRYSKDIEMASVGEKTLLDLGDVDATCEVSVNGCSPIVLMSKPNIVDITPYVHKGDNRIEVLVYSSLSNHYSTIPSPYRGTACAGLIGPVYIRQISTKK